MKVEIRCPECNRGTLIDEVSLGGEMLCPGCLTRITLRRPAAGVAAATSPRPAGAPSVEVVPAATKTHAAAPSAPATPQPTLRTAVPAVAPAPRATSAPGAAPAPRGTGAAVATVEKSAEPVVCPRCHLHFTPDTRAATPAEPETMTVLVVEDTAIFQEIARDALSDRYRVETVETAAEARAFLARGGIDLMVLDLTLEGGDHGRRFLAEFQVKPCPIVIFTARDESEMYGDTWEELKRLGADALVLKGMNVGESLRRKVGALLGIEADDEGRD